MENPAEAKISELVQKEPRYPAEAYHFVGEAVNFTVGRLPRHRHVSARELLAGVRDYARQEYGVLAHEVLTEWGLAAAADVGRVVYLMIGAGLLSASPEDRPEDFECEFTFDAPPAPAADAVAALPKID